MLSKVPQDAKIYTAGMEGIYPAELGNQFPIKVLQSRTSVSVYFDDGLGDHEAISAAWQPLDEFIDCQLRVIQ